MMDSVDELRAAMRCWATGVTIVTSVHDGVRHGMTVSSFTSVSLNPPLILVSLERTSRTRQLVLSSGLFAVNILRSDQEELSNRFAGRIGDLEDRFFGMTYQEMETGAPLIGNALAWLECKLSSVFELASHSLIIGQVVSVKAFQTEFNGVQPLIYFDRTYRQLK